MKGIKYVSTCRSIVAKELVSKHSAIEKRNNLRIEYSFLTNSLDFSICTALKASLQADTDKARSIGTNVRSKERLANSVDNTSGREIIKRATTKDQQKISDACLSLRCIVL